MTGREAESSSQLLHRGSQRERHNAEPQQAEPERGADLRVRADARRIVVGSARNDGWAKA